MSNYARFRLLASAAIFAVALGAPFGLAVASTGLQGADLGKTSEEIAASLASQGYEVRKVKPEDGLMEAYALKDGKRYEIYVDPATGKVTKVKEED